MTAANRDKILPRNVERLLAKAQSPKSSYH